MYGDDICGKGRVGRFSAHVTRNIPLAFPQFSASVETKSRSNRNNNKTWTKVKSSSKNLSAKNGYMIGKFFATPLSYFTCESKPWASNTITVEDDVQSNFADPKPLA